MMHHGLYSSSKTTMSQLISWLIFHLNSHRIYIAPDISKNQATQFLSNFPMTTVPSAYIANLWYFLDFPFDGFLADTKFFSYLRPCNFIIFVNKLYNRCSIFPLRDILGDILSDILSLKINFSISISLTLYMSFIADFFRR